MSPLVEGGGRNESISSAVFGASECAGASQVGVPSERQSPKSLFPRAEFTDQSAGNKWCKSLKSGPS